MPDTPSIDPHSEQFMTLLTDALRSGPGSPEWHQAVKTLRASNENVDEFKLLYAAREQLESGRDWRSITAGQGFTRKLFAEIESQSRAPRALPTATLIALIAAAVILSIVAGVFVMLLKGGGSQKQAIDQLTTTIFGNRLLSATFKTPGIPQGWERFGEAPLFARNGDLRPSTLPTGVDPKEYKVGGIVTAAPIAADQAIEIIVTLHAGKPLEDGIIEVFVADGPIVGEGTVDTRELTWIFQNAQAKLVLPSTRVEAQSEKLANLKEVQVKIQLNRDTAIVETAGKRMYAGPNQLAPDHPRYVGVRFRSRAGDTWERTGVGAIVVQKP